MDDVLFADEARDVPRERGLSPEPRGLRIRVVRTFYTFDQEQRRIPALE